MKSVLLFWLLTLGMSSRTALAHMIPFAFFSGHCQNLNSSWTPQWGDIVAHWSLNESSGSSFADSSGNGLNATGAGAFSAGLAGKVGFAANFDGSSGYLSVANNALLNITGNITVAAWVYSSQFNRAGWQEIVMKGSSGSRQYYLRPQASTGVAEFAIQATDGNQYLASGSTTMANNRWHFVVGTYDGATLSIYLDGKLDGSTSLPGKTLNTTTSILAIGRLGNQSAEYFIGRIDEVTIWSESLTTDQVARIYIEQACPANAN